MSEQKTGEIAVTESGCHIRVLPGDTAYPHLAERWGAGHMVILEADTRMAEVYLDAEAGAALSKALEGEHESEEELLLRLGFQPRYRLVKHPAWPDPLDIWPPTLEQAEKTLAEHPHPDAYITRRWESPVTVIIPPRGEKIVSTGTDKAEAYVRDRFPALDGTEQTNADSIKEDFRAGYVQGLDAALTAAESSTAPRQAIMTLLAEEI